MPVAPQHPLKKVTLVTSPCNTFQRPGAAPDAREAAEAADATHAHLPTPTGSRRRRLWELPADCHGALIGVCLPAAELRLIMNKLFGGESSFDDFCLHHGAVLQCSTRNKVSEPLQRELERRFAATVRAFNTAKTPEAVADLWAAAVELGEFAAALWAALTHPRCTPQLHAQLCRDIQMVQFRVAASVRADVAKADLLLTHNKALASELARLHERHARWQAGQQAERQAEREQFQAERIQAQAEASARDMLITTLRERPDTGTGPQPERESRELLLHRLMALKDRLAAAERELAAQEHENARLRDEQSLAAACIDPLDCEASARHPPHTHEPATACLQSQIVLCVGGRTGHIPIYRDLVEKHGGRFLHHDGGIEDNAHRLDAQLTAADMVVCQTGFLGHNAYGRVKDHCKKTGKRCVYVDKPGAVSFLRGLAQAPPSPGSAPNSAPKAQHLDPSWRTA